MVDILLGISEYKTDITGIQGIRLAGESELEDKSNYQCYIYYSYRPSNHD